MCGLCARTLSCGGACGAPRAPSRTLLLADSEKACAVCARESRLRCGRCAHTAVCSLACAGKALAVGVEFEDLPNEVAAYILQRKELRQKDLSSFRSASKRSRDLADEAMRLRPDLLVVRPLEAKDFFEMYKILDFHRARRVKLHARFVLNSQDTEALCRAALLSLAPTPLLRAAEITRDDSWRPSEMEEDEEDWESKIERERVLWNRGDLVVADLAGNTNLQRLSLYSLQLGTARHLEKLTNLMFLNFRHNNAVTDIRPLSGLTRLRTLWLGCRAGPEGTWSTREYGGGDLSPLSTLTNLTDLDVSRQAGVGDLTWVEPLTKLVRLNMFTVDDERDTLEPLGKLTNLTDLNISNTFEDGVSLAPLVALTELKTLHMEFVTPSDTEVLQNMKSLTYLNTGDLRLFYNFDAGSITNEDLLKRLDKLTVSFVEVPKELEERHGYKIVDLENIENLSDSEVARAERIYELP